LPSPPIDFGNYLLLKSAEGGVFGMSGGLVTKVKLPSETLMEKAAMDPP
jgi:hypothetical protein